jgi:Na+-transporting methylmalonyl-CoA/oxaloacetate decarboxylase gamma subunit
MILSKAWGASFGSAWGAAFGKIISNVSASVGGGGRRKILDAAKWILELLDSDNVKQTEQVKKVKTRLKKVKSREDLEDLQPIITVALAEMQKQKKLADDIGELNFIINELKIIRDQLIDEEEALLMLMA